MQAPPLLRMLDESQHPVRDRLPRRFVPGYDQDEEHRVELALRQTFALDLRVDELADQVVLRIAAALGRQTMPVLEKLERGRAAEGQHPVALALGAVVEDVGE